jgi:L-fuconate dehydratase
LYAKSAGKPLWKLLVDMTPEELVRCINFRYITDALTPQAALDILRAKQAGKIAREAEMWQVGYPAYTTSAGWLGYSDEKIRRLCRKGLAQGWHDFKIKVGRDLQDDLRRCRIMREEIGDQNRLMMDANQIWDIEQAIEYMSHLAQFNPWWIEEPTSPDDILGHATIAKAVAPIRVATGEHCQNRIMFKQLMQSGAIDVCQIDSCRLGGVKRGPCRISYGSKIRHSGLSARRRCRTMRIRPASPDFRLHRRQWHHRGSARGVCRSFARAFCVSGHYSERMLYATAGCRIQYRDEGR